MVRIYQTGRGFNKGGLHTISPTITINSWHENNFLTDTQTFVRKLTPYECWRLMGMAKDDYNKASQLTSNAQLYRQAGNSIVIDILINLFTQLMKTREGKNMNTPLRVFEAFAGIGAQHMALRNANIPHEVVAIAEIDEFAVKSYNAIHTSDHSIDDVSEQEIDDYLEKHNIPIMKNGKRKQLRGKAKRQFYEASVRSRNVGDIVAVDPKDIPDHDLMTYSFPCQDISVAGKGRGLDKHSGTRSGLLWECEKIIKEKRPKYLLMENVKNLIGRTHKVNFEAWLEVLEDYGYTTYWSVLNAKDYGVPQNRERVFAISIKGDHIPYEFPKPVALDKTLDDIIELEVDEKYYLSTERTKRLLDRMYQELPESPIVLDQSDDRTTYIGTAQPVDRRYNQKGIPRQEHIEFQKENISPSLCASTRDEIVLDRQFQLRKLTPLELWRLMGIRDSDLEKAKTITSDTQLYMQAGNSIAVPVLEGLFSQMMKTQQ